MESTGHHRSSADGVEAVRARNHAAIYRFMDAHRKQYPIAVMARVLGVSRSGYHAWKTRPPSNRARMDARLKKEIADLHARHGGRSGAPRIHEELLKRGWPVGRKRVARLMRELGVKGRRGGSRALGA